MVENLKKKDLYIALISFSATFQLHNMTLAFDLLRDTGLEVTSISPQGEEITHYLYNLYNDRD